MLLDMCLVALRATLNYSPTYPYSFTGERRRLVRHKYLMTHTAYYDYHRERRFSLLYHVLRVYYYNYSSVWHDSLLPIVDDFLGGQDQALFKEARTWILSRVFPIHYTTSREKFLDTTIRNLGEH